MDKKTINDKDFEYTIVMDASYLSPEADKLKPADGSAAAEALYAEEELLYADYEKMALMLPTVLDIDDAYPHSYQWRMGDRYDPAKLAALIEALNNRTKIEDTAAYRKYIEDMKGRRFKPESWD